MIKGLSPNYDYRKYRNVSIQKICLETEEGEYHILYSLFRGSNEGLDLVVVTTAGTTKELWDTYSPIFDTMGGFELIDMKRFEKLEKK